MASAAEGAAPSTAGAGFTVAITGQIESGRALGYDSLNAEYFFEAGPDWTRVDGIATGITQSAFRGGGGSSREAVWGMPLDVSYRTTNAYGWPRLGVAVSAADSLGRPVIVGYGSVLVPLSGSGHTRRIRLFAPVSSTVLQRFFAWLTANPPRYWKPNIVTQGTGREVTRVTSSGSVTVTLNVVTRGMTRHGYNAGTEPDSLPAEFVAAGMSTAPGLPGSLMGGPGGGAGTSGAASIAAPSPLVRSSTAAPRVGASSSGAPTRPGTWRRGASAGASRAGTPLSEDGRGDAGMSSTHPAAGAAAPEPPSPAASDSDGLRAAQRRPEGRRGDEERRTRPRRRQPADEAGAAPQRPGGAQPEAAPAPAAAPAPSPRDAKGSRRAPRAADAMQYGSGSARRGSDASAGSAGSRRSRGGSALDRFGGGAAPAPARDSMAYGRQTSGARPGGGSDASDL